MALSENTTSSFNGGYEETWTNVFRTNLDALFQLALLLTADSLEAEANLATVISTLDFSKQPDDGGSPAEYWEWWGHFFGRNCGSSVHASSRLTARSAIGALAPCLFCSPNVARICHLGMRGNAWHRRRRRESIPARRSSPAASCRSQYIAETEKGPGGVTPARPRSAPPSEQAQFRRFPVARDVPANVVNS
jgi:hypothetical protein